MKKLALVSLLIAGTAFAGNKEKADALFKQGKKLSAEKKYSEACPAFEQSMKLDPGIGTQLNIGKCYEDWGLLGKALVAYRAAEKMAHDAKDDREPKIKAIIDELDSNVPRLTIKLPKNATSEGVVVKLDGKPMTTFGEAMIIDPGVHTIDYTVDGEKKQKTVPVERGGDSEVTLDIPKDRVVKKQDPVVERPVVTDPGAAPGLTQRLGGLVLGGAGVIAIGVSSLMTLSARGQYNDALEMYCNNAKDMCDPMGLEQTHDARSTANTATVIFIGGAVAVGAGITLYLLAPKSAERAQEARYVVPSVTSDSAGVVYGGRF
jgi:serine/threonine-protein kinase